MTFLNGDIHNGIECHSPYGFLCRAQMKRISALRKDIIGELNVALYPAQKS